MSCLSSDCEVRLIDFNYNVVFIVFIVKLGRILVNNNAAAYHVIVK